MSNVHYGERGVSRQTYWGKASRQLRQVNPERVGVPIKVPEDSLSRKTMSKGTSRMGATTEVQRLKGRVQEQLSETRRETCVQAIN